MDRKVIDLAEPFPSRYVHQNPSGGGRYVTHSVVTQRLIAVLGAPPDFHLVEVIRGDVAAITPNPNGQSQRAKEGRPALTSAVVGVVCRLSTNMAPWVDRFEVEEAGDCEDPHNWPHDGARLKDAMSDAYKRCAMRLGCGLHLWLKDSDDYFLHDMLKAQNVEAVTGKGSDLMPRPLANRESAEHSDAPTNSQEPDVAVDPPASPGKPGDDAVAPTPLSGATAPPGTSSGDEPGAGGGPKGAEGEAASRPAAATTERATKEQLDRLAVSYGGQAAAIRAAWAQFSLTARELPSISMLTAEQADLLLPKVET